jgi:serine/threonine protein kinase
VKIVTHRETKQQYACKIMALPPADSTCKEDRVARKDTLREIDAVLDLDHPNVVGMREYFVHNNNVYLIMELLRGEDCVARSAKGGTAVPASTPHGDAAGQRLPSCPSARS